MVTCEPFQSYRVALKNCEQSIIEHNLVTIYLNLEWPENRNENPNLLIHVFDKKISQKNCKNDPNNSFLPLNQTIFSVDHQNPTLIDERNYSSSNFPPPFYPQTSMSKDQTSNVFSVNDQNDVSSTTNSNLVLNNIKTQIQAISPKSIKQNPIFEQRRLSNSLSPQCSSSNQNFHSPRPTSVLSNSSSSPIENFNHLQSNVNISPISSQATLTHRIDFSSSSSSSSSSSATVPSYPSLSVNSSTSSTLKASVCNCLKSSHVHETNCPMWNIHKQTVNSSPVIVQNCQNHRSLAQRAAVASQIRSNRNLSMTSVKEQGQTAPSFLSMPMSNEKGIDLNLNNSMLIQTEQEQIDLSKKKPTIGRQRSLVPNNNRVRKRTLLKQISLPTGTIQDSSRSSTEFSSNLFNVKEEIETSQSKLILPFPLNSSQRTISNADIDQTIDEVINGKGTISFNDQPIQVTNQPPSSQLVWVQSGAVTTKTWLSPLYQKQNVTTNYDSTSSTLTYQDVVNIAQQVVCPTETEQTKLTAVVLPPSLTMNNNNNNNNSKRRNRSKSTSNAQVKRNRQVKTCSMTRPHSNTTIENKRNEIEDETENPTAITPTLNLINKPSSLNSNGSSTDSVDKNDLWRGQNAENVDTMLDGFQFVSIDEQRNNVNQNFDFDLNIDEFQSKTNDRFSSMTPPAPFPIDHQRFSQASMEKFSHSFPGGDADVYEHFLNPMPISSSSSSIWQENQVTSSVSTPPDFQLSTFSAQPFTSQTLNQHFYSSPPEENHDHLHSQVRLLFDVQS